MKPLVLDSVTVAFGGAPLFAPVNVRVAPGTTTALVGPSGAGKSSLLHFVCGLLPEAAQTTGTVHIGDEALDGLPTAERRVGLLFQDPLLFPHLSVAGNVLFGLRAAASRRERRERVDAALADVGLGGLGDRDPATLSGGQQARVALLRVLLAKPRALLLDEPFRSLDDANRERLRALVFSEVERRQLPTLLVTHDRDDVAAAGGTAVSLKPQLN